ncbi:hypothetical protein HS125_14505 [bacterium]|nr:hypothetical protein [bacterium]
MMARFISEEVEVEIGPQPGIPAGFTWRDRRFVVARVLAHQLRLDHERRWYRRRHRDWFVVQTETGEFFKLYRHRGPGRSYWVLYEELDAEET